LAVLVIGIVHFAATVLCRGLLNEWTRTGPTPAPLRGRVEVAETAFIVLTFPVAQIVRALPRRLPGEFQYLAVLLNSVAWGWGVVGATHLIRRLVRRSRS
jgi:hypothetical protein